MRVVAVPTSNGIDDIKLIAETDSEAVFIRQLAEAGTLSSLSTSASSSVVFRAISVQSLSESNQVVSRGEIGKYDFTIRQNQPKTIGLTFIKAGVPINLTAYSNVKLQVKTSKGSSAIISLELGSGIEVSGDDENVLLLSFTADQTKQLCNESYYYDILFNGSAGNIYYMEGKINIKKTSTR